MVGSLLLRMTSMTLTEVARTVSCSSYLGMHTADHTTVDYDVVEKQWANQVTFRSLCCLGVTCGIPAMVPI